MSDSAQQVTQFNAAANEAAQHIVRYFQGKGFSRITEAMMLRIHQIAGGREEIEEAFELAQEQEKMPPLNRYFEIHPYGFFSEVRSLVEAKSALRGDFTLSLLYEVPKVYFEPAPVMADDPLASGTKYDVMMKLDDAVDGYAVVFLLNDPDASFIDYVGTHPGADWESIIGELKVATTRLVDAFDPED